MSIGNCETIIWITDTENKTVQYADPTYEEVWGSSPSHLYEDPLSFLDAIHPDDCDRVTEAIHSAPVRDYDEVYRIVRPDATERWIRDRAVPLQNDTGEVTRIARVARDITGLKGDEGDRLQYDESIDALTRNAPDIAFVIDEQGIHRECLAGSDSESHVYTKPDAFLDTSLHDVLPTDVADRFRDSIRRSLETGTLQSVELQLDGPSGQTWIEGRLTPIQGLSENTAFDRAVVFVACDSTDRIERERELAYQRSLLEAQQETILDGILVIDDDREFVTYNERFVELWDLPVEIVEGGDDDAAVEWVLERVCHPQEFLQKIEYLYEHPEETSRDEIELTDGRVFDRYSSPVTGDDGTHYGRLWMFRDITEQKAREAEIRQQRDELERLNHVNTIIRSINRAIVTAETREEVERAVCERLASADLYEFAVVGEFSPSYHHLTVRATSDAETEEFDDGQVTIPSSSVSESPAVNAAKAREVTAVRDSTAASHGVWDGISRDWKSYVVVPIVHDALVYGILVIFADLPGSFDEEERSVLEELGETIGHATNALERKQMLITDEVVEVEFRSKRYGEAFARLSESDGRATIDRMIPHQMDVQVLYVDIEGIDPRTIESDLEEIPEITNIRILTHDDDGGYVELRMEGETIPSVVAEYSGRVREMQLSDDELRIFVELPPEMHIRAVTDRLQEIDPTLTVGAHRTVSRDGVPTESLRTSATEQLPERQRTALEIGYFGGYFDWPRTSTGEELADQLDVSAPTFHYHLRHGERKLLELLFDETES